MLSVNKAVVPCGSSLRDRVIPVAGINEQVGATRKQNNPNAMCEYYVGCSGNCTTCIYDAANNDAELLVAFAAVQEAQVKLSGYEIVLYLLATVLAVAAVLLWIAGR
jgi:hypothetical protein